jgi:hypothetical protein
MRRFTALTLGIAALLATSGCMGHNPNTVAQVGGKEVSEAYVTEVEAVVKPLLDQGSELKRAAVVNWLMAITVVDSALDSIEASVPAETVAAVQEQDSVLALLRDQPGVAGEFAQDFAVFIAAVNGYAMTTDGNPLDIQALVDGVNAVEVEMNPKYGNWDSNRLVLDGSTGSLSESTSLETAVPAE